MRVYRQLPWLFLYAVAMAYVEAAVVVYLRAIYYPQGFAFPLAPMPPGMAGIEIGREAATLLMLLGVAMLAGAGRRERVLAFFVSFGVWDLFYYVWLWVFLRWPPSLLTWDILFLIPVPWIGPVLSPVIVSLGLVWGGVALLRREGTARAAEFSRRVILLMLAGAVLVLASLTVDFEVVVRHLPAPSFRWGLFCAGTALALAGFGLSVQGKR
ncbi:MAG: hypothetical protein ACTHM9_11195 [Gemmatimonadales bacterium]